MARSGIAVSGALDTWIRELPKFGRGGEVEDEWAHATHRMLLESRSVTHIETGQLRATAYSLTEQRGTKVEGQLWWPAVSEDGYHYAQQEFGLPNISRFRHHAGTSHDAPHRAFVATYDTFLRALIAGLERQAAGWG